MQPLCGAMSKRYGRPCRRKAKRGRTRCRFHGGDSTGWKTEAGKARTVAAMVAGRRAWLAKLKAAGLPYPAGRKPGRAWLGRRKLAEIVVMEAGGPALAELAELRRLLLGSDEL